MSNKLLHTYEEAGLRLGVSGKTIQRLIAAGEMKVTKFLGCRRVAETELHRFIESHQFVAASKSCHSSTQDRKTGTSPGPRPGDNVHDLVKQLTSGKGRLLK